jgi:hypothetical protein
MAKKDYLGRMPSLTNIPLTFVLPDDCSLPIHFNSVSFDILIYNIYFILFWKLFRQRFHLVQIVKIIGDITLQNLKEILDP